ncbi:MAG: hypothetical protein OXC63_01670 [Aestuariivita sp.]|nr:hypothetical protein [Aestuariivita sp.]
MRRKTHEHKHFCVVDRPNTAYRLAVRRNSTRSHLVPIAIFVPESGKFRPKKEQFCPIRSPNSAIEIGAQPIIVPQWQLFRTHNRAARIVRSRRRCAGQVPANAPRNTGSAYATFGCSALCHPRAGRALQD